jgi:flavin reductase (DIM6/NTAB) family NADH-FMN oxidoreductase RutF
VKKSLGAKTLIHPTPVWLVGTYDRDGKPNVMTAAWGGICCSKPPCVAVSLRKATYSYASIVFRKAYTISIPSEIQLAEAVYLGTASGKNEDKFVGCGFTPVRSELVDAPFIAEVPLVLECKLLHTYEIGLHTQFVGEIMDVKAEESVLGEDGYPDMQKVKPIVYAPYSQVYFGIGEFMGNSQSAREKLKK